MKKFSIPLQSEVVKYIKEKKGWPDPFCEFYGYKFWNHYQASGWKLSSGNQIKDWKACFNSQWQQLKFKEDIEMLNKLTGNVKTEIPVMQSEMEKLDAFINEMRKPGIGVNIPFKDFGQWYAWMKEKKLLAPMYQSEIDELKRIYNNDYEKCRCAAVQRTLMGYINNGLRVSDLLKMRAAL